MKMKKFSIEHAIIGAMRYTFLMLVLTLICLMIGLPVTLKIMFQQNPFYYMFVVFIFFHSGVMGANVQNKEALKRAKEQSKKND